MTISDKEVRKLLAKEKIFAPGSEELATHERHLTRYFEREYRRLLENPVSLESLGISTSEGPMVEETQALMDAHYDQPPEFFKSFLDRKYMAYSMAYYGENPETIMNSRASLEEAQQAKFALIAKRAGIKGHERILNIGCGFGSLETYLFERFPNIEIISITPSSVQIHHLRNRMSKSSDPLNNNNFYIIHGSFDKLMLTELGENKFDLVISIAVCEQIYNMESMLEKIHRLLIPGGHSFHHFITSLMTIPNFIHPSNTMIGRYFPGGRVWPHMELALHTKHLEIIESWFLNGLNYWRTLDEWHYRYWKNISVLYQSSFNTKSIAHWNEYFSLCKSVFAPLQGTVYGNSHYLFKKTQ